MYRQRQRAFIRSLFVFTASMSLQASAHMQNARLLFLIIILCFVKRNEELSQGREKQVKFYFSAKLIQLLCSC